MKYLFLILFCCFVFSICKAQVPIVNVAQTEGISIVKLKKQGIKFFVSYHVDCRGFIQPYNPDSCNIFTIRYLFWKKRSKYFIQRFDDCNSYMPIEIKQKLVDKVAVNLQEIKKAEIEYPEYLTVIDGKKLTLTSISNHSCHHKFEIYTGGKKIVKDVDEQALDVKLIENKYPNINYEKNRRSILVSLIKQAEQASSILNKKAP